MRPKPNPDYYHCLSVCPHAEKLNAFPPFRDYGQMVAVTVGDPKVKFQVHEGLIVGQSRYFRSAFDGGFQEASTKTIHISEVSVEVVEAFLNWLYTRRLPEIATEATQADQDDQFDLLCELYIFADARFIVALKNATIDALCDSFARFWTFPWSAVKMSYENTAYRSSPLRKFMADMAAQSLGELRVNLDAHRDWFRKIPDFLIDLTIHLSTTEDEDTFGDRRSQCLWDEVRKITPGETVTLAQLGTECVKTKGRPFRVAVDTPMEIFKYKWSTANAKEYGGMNHPVRNFFFRITHLLTAGVEPVFVYDGPGKPQMKRGKASSYTPSFIGTVLAAAASSMRTKEDIEMEYGLSHVIRLTKDLLDYFGIPWLEAPGEAEAQCAQLEKEGIVDAIITKDVEKRSRHVITACNYRMEAIKNGTNGLSREDLILIAVMGGGDYGGSIPGFGPQIAIQAAKAGYGRKLCEIAESEDNVPQKLTAWKRQLTEELRTNYRGKFEKENATVAGNIPSNFPNPKIVNYYLKPAVSSPGQLDRLRATLRWDKEVDVTGPRKWTYTYVDWKGKDFGRKFVEKIAPALIAKKLLIRAGDNVQEGNRAPFSRILDTREDACKGYPPEACVEYDPLSIVGINLSAEPYMRLTHSFGVKRVYNPFKPQNKWVLAHLIERGAPQEYQDWKRQKPKNAASSKPKKSAGSKPKKAAGPKPKGISNTDLEKTARLNSGAGGFEESDLKGQNSDRALTKSLSKKMQVSGESGAAAFLGSSCLTTTQPMKRGPDRPRKHPQLGENGAGTEPLAKRKRGRPRKDASLKMPMIEEPSGVEPPQKKACRHQPQALARLESDDEDEIIYMGSRRRYE
ncbi:uncharacterized protein K452DRAFT_318814 [Aplosporella prunicola CBS 121167]|uniref:BTB domain-containing protein n=1 Tax=Aplosporella prunicola CBS 121167 TaxID=1176127 RepID=A0A6A6BER8_9PEZI|nr:uncharacterized protein K452DRAFT_318814 [Aplosporella prunicola CBS 121167]KAF2141883.1 hypothetical protein K452DRAFT_318814 [Aplosporella prunicola CBS 121167]